MLQQIECTAVFMHGQASVLSSCLPVWECILIALPQASFAVLLMLQVQSHAGCQALFDHVKIHLLNTLLERREHLLAAEALWQR